MPTDERPAPSHRTWAEIDLAALAGNLAAVRELHPDTAVMAVVKADAYGHGVTHIAETFAALGIEFLGVANATEARRVARAEIGDTRVFLLGPTAPGERPEIAYHRWTPCLSSLDEARDLDRFTGHYGHPPLAVHLAVDTGMGRGGFLLDDLPAAAAEVRALPNLDLEGIGSHLASADEDPPFTRSQIAAFETAVTAAGGASAFRFRHLANSAGLLGYPLGITNLVRPGLALYGLSPLPGKGANLQPVLTLKARITLVRTLPAGHGISYGRTFVTEKPTTVATVGIGYGDGLPRNLPSGDTTLLVNGHPCPLLGRVTMDQVMVDVSALPVPPAPGDTAVVIGSDGPHTRTAAGLAGLAGTIPWEVLARLTPARVHKQPLIASGG